MNASPSTLAPLGSPRSSALSLLTRVRVLVLAFALLAGGFAALAPHAAQEASAAGGCRVGATVHYSNGYVTGTGGSNCGYNANQTVKVTLYKNGVWQTSRTVSAYTSALVTITPAIWAPYNCNVRYQVSTTHYVNGYQSTSWAIPFVRC